MGEGVVWKGVMAIAHDGPMVQQRRMVNSEWVPLLEERLLTCHQYSSWYEEHSTVK